MRLMRIIGLAALVAGLTLAVTAPALGHGISFARGVGASFIPPAPDGPPYTAVTGKVRSPNPACRRRALVTLWKLQPGKDIDYGARRTTRRGLFTIPAPGNQFPPGDYYLTVKRKVLANSRFHRHICPRLRAPESGGFTITNPAP